MLPPPPSSACPSPRTTSQQQQQVPAWAEQYAQQLQALRSEIAEQIRWQMASIVGHLPTADLLLVAADGRKMPAHLCILKQRAPSFFQRYVQATLDAITPRNSSAQSRRQQNLLEIAVGGVDSAALEFFVRSIYTDEEVLGMAWGTEETDLQQHHQFDDGGGGNGGSHGTGRGNGHSEGGTGRNGQSSSEAEGKKGSQQQQQAKGHQQMPADGDGRWHERMTEDAADGNERHQQQQLRMPQQMSASYPSPRSPSTERNGHHFPLISFRDLSSASSIASTSQQCLQQRSPATLPRPGPGHHGPGLIPRFIGLNQPRDDGGRQNEDEAEGGRGNREVHEQTTNRPNKGRNSSSSIFPFFIGIDDDQQDSAVASPKSTTAASATAAAMMSRSLPSNEDHKSGGLGQRSESPIGLAGPSELAGTIRGRALVARRLSGCSINSLTSIDMLTPSQEQPPTAFLFPGTQQQGEKLAAASRLGQDLLAILAEEEKDPQTADVRVLVENGARELPAHSCILWASGSEFFKENLSYQMHMTQSYKKIELHRFSAPSVKFLLQFLYGGVSCLPTISDGCSDLLDPWELLELGVYTKVEMFQRVVVLHLRAICCHFFHRPCASCVSAVFDMLPKMGLKIPELKQLFGEAMQWQAVHFTRIWKGRVFLHLVDGWQKQCRDALLQSVDEESVIEVLLGCEKLALTLPRHKLQGQAQKVQKMVADVEEYCLEFLANSLDSLVQSRAFSSHGKGLALNLTLLEDILPPLIHSLSADTTIRTFVALKELIAQQLEERSRPREHLSAASSCTNSPVKKVSLPPIAPLISTSSSRGSSLHGSTGSLLQTGSWREQMLMDEWNPRFKSLCLRLLDLLDRHMLHYANSIVNSTEWALLNPEEQARIREFGLFVELRMPRVSPPRLSSAGRSYKRSSSVGFGHQQHSGTWPGERTRSLERNSSSLMNPIGSSRPSLSTQVEEEVAENGSNSGRAHEEEEEQEKQVEEMKKSNEQLEGREGRSGRAKEEKSSKIPAKLQPKDSGQKRRKSDEERKKTDVNTRKTEKEEEQKVGEGKRGVEEEELRPKRNEEKKKKEEQYDVEAAEPRGRGVEKEEATVLEFANRQRTRTKVEKEKPKEKPASPKPELEKAAFIGTESNGKEAEKEPKANEEQPEASISATVHGDEEGGGEKAVKKRKSAQRPTKLGRKAPPPVQVSTTAMMVMNERQRTHTVLTLEQNLKAGINIHLDHVGPMPSSTTVQQNASTENTVVHSATAAPEVPIHQPLQAKMNGSSATVKPQSIVRPMPKIVAVVPTDQTANISRAPADQSNPPMAAVQNMACARNTSAQQKTGAAVGRQMRQSALKQQTIIGRSVQEKTGQKISIARRTATVSENKKS